MESTSEVPANSPLGQFLAEHYKNRNIKLKDILGQEPKRGYFRYRMIYDSGPVLEGDVFLTPDGKLLAGREITDSSSIDWSSDERLITIRKQTSDGPLLGMQIRQLKPGSQQIRVLKPPYYDPQFWFSEERLDGNYIYHAQVDKDYNISGAWFQLEPPFKKEHPEWRMPIIISFKEGLQFLVPADVGTGFKVLKQLSVEEEVVLESFSYKVTRFERHILEVEVRDLPDGNTIRKLTISPLDQINVAELFNKMNSEDASWKDLFDQIPMSLEIMSKIPPKTK